jgi:hypothetical protein
MIDVTFIEKMDLNVFRSISLIAAERPDYTNILIRLIRIHFL